jgi:hypothetical protein
MKGEKVRLEVESLENRSVPALALLQLSGHALVIQGVSTGNAIQVFEKGDKLTVVLTDLSDGLSVSKSFHKEAVRHVEFHPGTSGDDLFENELHDKHIETQTFDDHGIEVGDTGGGSEGSGRGGRD